MGLPDEPRFESGDALYTARVTLPAPPCGTAVRTEDYTCVPERFLEDQRGIGPSGGAAAAHTRGLAPYSEGRKDGREKAEEAEVGEGF